MNALADIPAATSDSLRESTVRGIRHIGVATYAARLVSLASLFVLARILSPTDFGIAAIALVIGNFLNNLSDFGLSPAIVSHGATTSAATTRRLASVRFALALGVFGAVQISAQWIADILGAPDAGAPIRVMGTLLLIAGASFTPATELLRNRRFKEIASARVVSSVAQAIVTVALAFQWRSYWAIVGGQLAGSASAAIALWYLWPERRHKSGSPMPIRAFLVLGSLLTLSWLSVFVLFSVDRFFVVSKLGLTQLGYYAFALQWGTFTADSLGPLVSTIGLPTLASLAGDRPRLIRAYLSAISLVSFIALPASLGLVIIGPELLGPILGGGSLKWWPSLHALQILAFLGLLRSITEPASSVFLATNTFKKYAHLAGVQLLAFILLMLLLFGWFPSMEAVALSMVLAYLLNTVLIFRAISKVLDLRPRDLVEPLWAPAVAATIMLAALAPVRFLVSPTLLSLVGFVCLGGFVYVAAFFVTRQSSTFHECISIIRGVISLRRVPR